MLNMDAQYRSEDGTDFGPTGKTTENSHKSRLNVRVRVKLKSMVTKSITCIVTV